MHSVIQKYLQSTSRNKIIVSYDKIIGFEYIDIGIKLCEKLDSLQNTKTLSFEAKYILSNIIEESIYSHNRFGQIIGLTNLGILFEDHLKIDFLNFIDSNSKSSSLLLHWEGVIENKTLFFQDKNSKIKFNINTISHLII